MTRITGRVVADDGYFDAARSVANWRPSVTAYCGPLSALTLNESFSSGGGYVDDPSLAAASTLTKQLRAAGVRVAHAPARGVAPITATLAYTERSAPLSRVLAAMNKPSDNFLAEELLKGLGAGFGDGGTTVAGADVAKRFLQSIGVSDGFRIRDGSGLSYQDKLTARVVLKVLGAMAKRADFPVFRRSLAVAGVDGTLEVPHARHRRRRQRARQDRHAQRRQQPLRLRDHGQRPHAQLRDAHERRPGARRRGARRPGRRRRAARPLDPLSPGTGPRPRRRIRHAPPRYPSPPTGHSCTMARPLWKGAISFGLVTIPVNVFSATRRDELRFRQLDRRDNTPISEKRVNEETGEEVAWDDIVKGFEYDEGTFVVLDQDDFSKANVKATETIDIVQAVPHDAVPAAVLREAAVRGARPRAASSRTTSCARRCAAPAGSPSR